MNIFTEIWSLFSKFDSDYAKSTNYNPNPLHSNKQSRFGLCF